MSEKTVVVVVCAVCVLAALRMVGRAVGRVDPGRVGANIGRGAVNAGAGVIQGIGDAVGIPRTNPSQCEADIQAGRWWDASFSCPAGTFVSRGWNALWS